MIKNLKRRLLSTALVLSAIMAAFSLSAGAEALSSDSRELVPMGCTIGIQMRTDGVLVVGLSVLETEDGEVSPSGEAGILPGDLITMIGNSKVGSAEEFLAVTANLGGERISVTVNRGGKVMQFAVTPQLAGDGSYKLGLWLRDSVAGIGTVTFYDPDSGLYGALGHPISDADTGIIMPLGSGSVTNSTVIDIRKGISGTPGELSGSFDQSCVLGSILQNTESGIFGIMDSSAARVEHEPMEVASESEITLGPATIYANVNGTEVKEYSAEITRVYRNDDTCRSLMLTVTDPELLEITGGIVQGMSGSPIIQSGKLIGAVTHVLINDPTRGYGISVEHMLETAENSSMDKAA